MWPPARWSPSRDGRRAAEIPPPTPTRLCCRMDGGCSPAPRPPRVVLADLVHLPLSFTLAAVYSDRREPRDRQAFFLHSGTFHTLQGESDAKDTSTVRCGCAVCCADHARCPGAGSGTGTDAEADTANEFLHHQRAYWYGRQFRWPHRRRCPLYEAGVGGRLHRQNLASVSEPDAGGRSAGDQRARSNRDRALV